MPDVNDSTLLKKLKEIYMTLNDGMSGSSDTYGSTSFDFILATIEQLHHLGINAGNFLDLGSGKGAVVGMFQACGYNAFGVEEENKFVVNSNAALGKLKLNQSIMHGNYFHPGFSEMSFQGKHVNDMDILYCRSYFPGDEDHPYGVVEKIAPLMKLSSLLVINCDIGSFAGRNGLVNLIGCYQANWSIYRKN